MSNKRYFWFKLYEDFFSSNRIKKLRKIAGGDTYTIIYLKMQLKALKQDGYLFFNGYFSDFYEELALDIDEDATNVRITCEYLLSVGLLEVSEDGKEYYLSYLENCIGSETASTQRSRASRKRKKEQKLLQCNASATQEQQKMLQCNTGATEMQRDLLQSNTDATPMQHLRHAEKEKEKELEIELEKDNSISSTDVSEISSDNEKELSDPEPDEPVTPKTTKVIEKVIEQWNSLSDLGITPVRIFGPNTPRGKMLRARLRQFGEDSFREVVEQIRQSDFLQGQNPRAWAITFDWVILPKNYPKVLEGNYKTTHNNMQGRSGTRNFLPTADTNAGMSFEELEKRLLEN